MTFSEGDEEFQTHSFTYRHDGADWVLHIKATSAEDARARVAKLPWAHYDGTVHGCIPVPERFGIGKLIRRLFVR